MSNLLGVLALSGCGGQDYSIVDEPDTIIQVTEEVIEEVAQDPDSPYTDTMYQPDAVTNLDVLVVMDRSCSMYDDATRVGNGMVTLQQDIDALVDDTRFGFITADPNVTDFQGPFDSSQAIDIAMAPNMLSTAAGQEMGFAAAYTFVSDYAATTGDTAYSDFLRAEASLLMFMVSDEEEQSSISAQLFYDWMGTLKPDGNHDVVSITTIPPDPSYCGSTSYGCKYIELSEDFYGKPAVDLEGASWETWISSASFLTSMVYEMPLTYVPLPETIHVKRDDAIIAADQWQYWPGDNVVEFLFDPDFNEVDTVTYDYIPAE